MGLYARAPKSLVNERIFLVDVAKKTEGRDHSRPRLVRDERQLLAAKIALPPAFALSRGSGRRRLVRQLVGLQDNTLNTRLAGTGFMARAAGRCLRLWLRFGITARIMMLCLCGRFRPFDTWSRRLIRARFRSRFVRGCRSALLAWRIPDTPASSSGPPVM